MGHEAQRRPDKSWGNANPYTFDDSTELSDKAIQQIKNLPDWLPAVGGIDRVNVTIGGSKTLDIQSSTFSLDGKAKVADVGQPEYGALKSNGGGKWTYTPKANFQGDDKITYTAPLSWDAKT